MVALLQDLRCKSQKNERLNAQAQEFKPRLTRSPPMKSQYAPPMGSRPALRQLEARRRAILERRYYHEYAARALMRDREEKSAPPPPQPPSRERRPYPPPPANHWQDLYRRHEMYGRFMKNDNRNVPQYGTPTSRRQQSNEIKNANARPNSQGRGFKTKQKKINVVYNNLVERFGKTPFLKQEVDRSYETSRVHAKTWDGLNIIEKALEQVMNDPEIQMQEIGFHKSMKNKYQQKGILVYIKVSSQKQVQKLFKIYDSFDGHLKDHAIAVSKEEREKMIAQNESDEKTNDETSESETPGQSNDGISSVEKNVDKDENESQSAEISTGDSIPKSE